jgi:hypothetical protein
MKTRKEMKEEFKQMKYKIGVFQIRNKRNGKVFIGSSLDLTAIWYAQKLQLDVGMHESSGLQEDWRKYGPENFVYEIIEEIKQDEEKPAQTEKELKVLEALILEEKQPYEEKGYNRRKTKM